MLTEQEIMEHWVKSFRHREGMARDRLNVNLRAFARAIEQAATRKALTQARPLTAACLLAKPHSGMRVDYRGLFKQARQGLRASPGIAEMLRQFEDHITELGQRWYAGDAAVVDELLQLYCVERDTRRALLPDSKGEA